MHFFDPTVDWPEELQGEEIPDLLFLKSHKPLNTNFGFPSPSLAGRFSNSAVWTEYTSVGDHPPFVNILLLQPSSIEENDEDHVNALLDDIGTESVEIAKYRKIACNKSWHDDSSEPAPFVQCWAWYTVGCGLNDTRLSFAGNDTRRTMFKVLSKPVTRNRAWEPPPYLVLEQLDSDPSNSSLGPSPGSATANKVILRLVGGSHEPAQIHSAPGSWASHRMLPPLTKCYSS